MELRKTGLFTAILILLLGLCAAALAADVPINETTFPDAILRAYICQYCDTDQNGSLSEEEIGNIAILNVQNRGIESLKGIEYFTELFQIECNGNKLTELDVSRNTKLMYLTCSKNQIVTLNLKGCSELLRLDCQNNKITQLDVSGLPKLQYLSCNNNALTALDVSKNTELTDLGCIGNTLSSLDLTHNPKLFQVGIGDSHSTLSSLDLSKNPELETLIINYTKITKLDLSRNTKLGHLDLSFMSLTGLDLSQNTELWKVSIQRTDITSLDLSHNPLVTLEFSNNKTSSLTLGSQPDLSTAHLLKNEITTLDVRECPILCGYMESAERVSANGLDKFGEYGQFTFDPWVKVIGPYISDPTGSKPTPTPAPTTPAPTTPAPTTPKPTTPKPTTPAPTTPAPTTPAPTTPAPTTPAPTTPKPTTPAPTTPAPTTPKPDNPEDGIAIDRKHFPDKEFRTWIVASYDRNEDGVLSEDEIAEVTFISCANYGISSLAGIEYFTALESLYCKNNKLKTLDISKNTELTLLDCRSNKLTKLDISQNQKLEVLNCENNKLTKLDVKKCSALRKLMNKKARGAKKDYDYFSDDFTFDADVTVTGDFVSYPGVTVKGGRYQLNQKMTAAIFTGPAKRSVTSLVIQDTMKIGGKSYKVTEIIAGACKGLKKLTTLTIGKNVKIIGENAFNGCGKLKKITIKGSVLKTVGKKAFSAINKKALVYCAKALIKQYQKLLMAFGLPKTVTFKAK